MTPYRSLSDKPYVSDYLYHETVIDYPVAALWPHVLDIGGWMSAHGLETIDGSPGQIGHFGRVLPRNLPDATPEPRYHLYGVAAIVPHKLVALEVFPEAGGSYGNAANKTSFDTILLTDLGDRTHLGFYMIDVLLTPRAGEQLHAEDPAVRHDRLCAVLDSYFANLRALADAAGNCN